jgi:hypothetical protein
MGQCVNGGFYNKQAGGGGGGGAGDVTGPASSTDNAIARFDSTNGKVIQNSSVIVSDNADITAYDATNTGNPEIRVGSSNSDEYHIQAVYGAGTQTLDYMLFTTDSSLLDADGGFFKFNLGNAVTNADILDIDSTGINLTANRGLSINGTSIISDSSGTATLNNIDALDATTTATIAAAAGGFADWKTIGTGGDYADVQAMIDGGDTKGVLLSNVTEDSNIAVPAAGLVLHLNDFTLTMGANQFTFAGNYNCTVEGWGPTSEIDYTQTSAGQELFDTGANTGSTVTLRNFTFDNNSSASSTYLATATSIHYVDNLHILNPNVAQTGVYINNALSRVSNLYYTSPGTTNSYALYVTLGTATNITFDGTWSTTAYTIRQIGGTISNVNTSGTLSIEFGNDAYFSNFKYSGGTPKVTTLGDGGRMVNAKIYTLDINSADDYYFFDNCQIVSTISDNASSGDVYFNNCELNGNATLDGDDYTFNNCVFRGTVTTQSGASHIAFIGCNIDGAVTVNGDFCRFNGTRVGAEAGGGATTITIAGTADGTSVVGCLTDAAISDSGTNTVVVGNITY